MKKVLSMLVFCMVLITSVSAQSSIDVTVNDVLKTGWAISESANEEVYVENVRSYEKKAEQCAEMIIESELKNEFIKKYKELNMYDQALLQPVVDILAEKYRKPAQELFPGYGYADPEYNYKLGRELYVYHEVLGTFWRKEVRKTKSHKVNETIVEKTASAGFIAKITANGGKILGKVESSMNVNGTYKNVVTVKYTIEKEIQITCTVKYEKIKKWFELYRQKDGWVWNGDWEYCGRTYKIYEEASGEEVAVDAGRIMDQEFLAGYGYLDPDYEYKKGQEISRESLGAFWRDEVRHIESNKVHETTVEKSLAGGFTAKIIANGGKILGKAEAGMNINGSYKKVVKIKYTVKKSIQITCKVKYQKSKAWFKLYRRYKVSVWTKPEWKYVGNFYEVFEEASGEEVASDSRGEVADQDYFPGYGHADPEFEYKIGEEHSRKIINSFWAVQNETLKSNKINTTTVSKKALAEFKVKVLQNGGEIIQIDEDVITVNGQKKKVYTVTHQNTEDIEVKCNVKFNVVKISYTLYRRKKVTAWPHNWHKWYGCGLTYEKVEEMTKVSVVE